MALNKDSLLSVGGDEGEGGPISTKYLMSTPTPVSSTGQALTLPHRKGEGVIREISNMSAWC